MKTILSGRVSTADINDAAFMAGIDPTSFLTNGLSHPPAASKLPHVVHPIDKMLPEGGEARINYVMCQHADALICAGGNEHLLRVARQYKLVIYEI